MQPSYRSRLARPSVCPSGPYELVTQKQKNVEKSKIIMYTFLWARVSGIPNFNWKVKVTGRQKPQKIAEYLAFLFSYGLRINCRRLRRRLQIRQMPLFDLIYSQRPRRWAAGRTAAYHIGTRRRHLFCYYLKLVAVTVQLHSTILSVFFLNHAVYFSGSFSLTRSEFENCLCAFVCILQYLPDRIFSRLRCCT